MSRTRRALSLAGLSGTAALLAAAGGATWYYASRLTEQPGDARVAPPLPIDLVRVTSSADDVVTISGPDAARPGTWGLAAADGYLQVGAVTDAEPDRGTLTVTRALLAATGTVRPGDEATFDAAAYPGPDALGLPWQETDVATPVGPAPAWWFPAGGSTWAILIHGRSASRHETLRLVPTLHDLDVPALAVTYRGDGVGPRSPDGRSHLGATEWEDVAAAIRFARDAGAIDVVLVGYSMGGACAVNCVRFSDLGDHVRAMVLDAPVLDWGPVVRGAALARGLPAAVLPVLLPGTMALAAVRAGLDWASMRYLDDPTAFTHETLLIHGDADPIVPVELADALADARPDIVTYHRVAGAGHVRSWNHDPAGTEGAVRAFLTAQLTAG